MSVDSGTRIHVTFDPDTVLAAIELWRNATDLKMPLADEFKIHFMKNRGALLQGYEKSANAMSIMLRGMSPTDDVGLAELEKVRVEIESFRTWANDELVKLRDMARGTE
jgi:hypothetical protein